MELIGFTSTFDEIKNVVFTNLLLLGFDQTSDPNAHGVKFDKDMFDDANKVGAEVILSFLFNRLNPELANEEFKMCYPVLDKIQDQCFRKVCGNWILNIAKENREFDFPSAVSSILMKKGGKKFYLLLFSLSRYVLFEVAKIELDESHVFRIVPPTNLKKMNTVEETKKKIFQALLDQHTNNFVKTQYDIANSVREDSLQPYIAQYYNLKKKIKSTEAYLESMLQELDISALSEKKIIAGEYCEEWNKLINATKKWEEKIKNDWEIIESVVDTKRDLWNSCSSVVVEKKQPLVLDGHLIETMLPQSLDVNQAGFTSADQRLCLTKLSEAWLISLEYLASHLEQMGLPKINIISDDVIDLHSRQLQHVDKLLADVDSMLSNTREEFSKGCNRESISDKDEQYKQQIGVSGLCLPSPPINLGANIRRDPPLTPSNSSSTFAFRLEGKVRCRHSYFPSSARVNKKTASLNQIKKVPSEKSNIQVDRHAFASMIPNETFDLGAEASQCDVEKDFNLNALESPLREHFSTDFVSHSSTDNATHRSLSLLKTLIKKKRDELSNEGSESQFTADGKVSSVSEFASQETVSGFSACRPALPSLHSGSPIDRMYHMLTLSDRSYPTKSSQGCSTDTSLSRANLSLVDIFGEDDTCLIPPSP